MYCFLSKYYLQFKLQFENVSFYMNTSEELFFNLIKEIFLVSDNQRANPVKIMIENLTQFKLEQLNRNFEEYITMIKTDCFGDQLELLFLVLHSFFYSYYLKNVSYFNYKIFDNKSISEFEERTEQIVSNTSKYVLISLNGHFLIPQNIQQTKENFLKSFISNKIFDTKGFKINNLISNENLLKYFLKCIDEVFKGIETIESLLLEVYTSLPNSLSESFIISNKTLINELKNIILKNSSQSEEWNSLYSYNQQSAKDSDAINIPGYCIDTSHFSSRFIVDLFKTKDWNSNSSFDSIDGLLIQADNFKGLRYLQGFFTNKIDCIYIDPPYNTGSGGFLYDDTYRKSHWYWLMENRLHLAYNLLSDDGVLFVSIDDHELVTIRLILDEIFDRFVGMYVWHKKTQPSFLNKELISVTEYILVYKKGKDSIAMKGGFTDPNKHTELINISNEVTNRILPNDNTLIYNNGKLFNGVIHQGVYGHNKLQITLNETITITNGVANKNIPMVGRFRWTQTKIDGIKEENRSIVIKNLKTLRPTVSGSGEKKIRPPITLLSKKINNIPTNTDGNFEMKDLFTIPPFYYPKPVNLIKFLIDSVTYNKKDALILDFFAGSGTTGHAIINLNREDGGTRKFILIEQAEYFETILIPRIKKVLYTNNWQKGQPISENSFKALIKVIKFN